MRSYPPKIVWIFYLATLLLVLLFMVLYPTRIVHSNTQKIEARDELPQVELNVTDSEASKSFTIGNVPVHAQLRWRNQVLIDQPSAHLGQPQLSPDGRTLAMTLIPAGSETARWARTYLFDTSSGQLHKILAGHTPRWDGQSGELILQQSLGNEARISSRQLQTKPLYPQTIRVAHHPNNSCRDVTPWQVDEISFEEYVARSVPAEMPTSWPHNALAAQSIATRTYAWYQILQERPDYDVTDWANFQMMCDERYPASDEAVAATAGQYLSAVGDSLQAPILAMYSAENGHPTLTNPNVDYLQAVPDLFSLGKPRWGHGYGLSQWGAYRRALAGQRYEQILGHYYSHIHLQNVIPDLLMGALIIPTDNSYLSPGGLRWQVLTDPTSPMPSLVITSTAGLTRTVLTTVTTVITQSMPVTTSIGVSQTALLPQLATITKTMDVTAAIRLSGTSGVWLPTLALPEQTVITTELWFNEVLQEQMTLLRDTVPPASPELTWPDVVTPATSLLEIDADSDAAVGVRLDWVWEGEALFHTENSGISVQDNHASNGFAWGAQAGIHDVGVWYGPYTTQLHAGHSYRALFWLRTTIPPTIGEAIYPANPVARLDVADHEGAVLLGLRDVWLSDFLPNAYTPIAVDFHLFDRPQGIEFRVAWPGQIDLALDRVEVWRLSTSNWQSGLSLDWLAHFGEGERDIYVAAFDEAGYISSVINHTIRVVESPKLYLPSIIVNEQ